MEYFPDEPESYEDMSYTLLKRKSGFSQTRFGFFLWSGEEKRKDLDTFSEDEHKFLKTEQILCEALLADMSAQELKLLEMLENKNDDDSTHLFDIKRGIRKLNEIFADFADDGEPEIDHTKVRRLISNYASEIEKIGKETWKSNYEPESYKRRLESLQTLVQPNSHMSVSWKEILDQKIKNAKIKVEMFNVHIRIETIKQRYEKPDGIKRELLESIWVECIDVIKRLERFPLRGFQVVVVQNVIGLIKNKKFLFKPIVLPEDRPLLPGFKNAESKPLSEERDIGNSEEVQISSNSTEMAPIPSLVVMPQPQMLPTLVNTVPMNMIPHVIFPYQNLNVQHILLHPPIPNYQPIHFNYPVFPGQQPGPHHSSQGTNYGPKQ
ncbi:hypothetical protein GCK72_023970 [Caenorhabditis remanei]|uniref:Uncharacterized protein n=1 Tax=Caenorhabditis remanei TaxID=31234 RepID=A0A6A5FYA0_CAERE|nr:hypothetical protein GCK72_023970 [Caenorhabditis remanei]KAF1747505.1 hypothetical protein GCK72_023970 [Caenorhabditis remanei]